MAFCTYINCVGTIRIPSPLKGLTTGANKGFKQLTIRVYNPFVFKVDIEGIHK